MGCETLYFFLSIRLPSPKPFGCQKSNRLRIATQVKNAQRLNNPPAGDRADPTPTRSSANRRGHPEPVSA